MKSKISILLCIAVWGWVNACSEKDPEPAVEELLTAGDWHPETDGDDPAVTCYKRSVYRFTPGGELDRFSYSIGVGEECVMYEHDQGVWQLLNGDTELQMQFGGGPRIFRIERISDAELLLWGSWSGSAKEFLFDKTPH